MDTPNQTQAQYTGENLPQGELLSGRVDLPHAEPLRNPIGRIITISPQDYGYLVKVGCQTVAIESKARLIEKLTAYILDPIKTEELYNSGKLFN